MRLAGGRIRLAQSRRNRIHSGIGEEILELMCDDEALDAALLIRATAGALTSRFRGLAA